MIVGCAAYRFGHPIGGTDQPTAAAAARGHGNFAWLGLVDPDLSELSRVTAGLGIAPEILTEATADHRRTTIVLYEHALLLVLKPARYDPTDELVSLTELDVILAADAVVTVRRGVSDVPELARRALEADPDRLAAGPAAVLLEILQRVVNEYDDVLRGLRDDIEAVERDVFSPEDGSASQRIYVLKREVLDFQLAAESLHDLLEDLAEGSIPFLGTSLRGRFAGVEAQLERQVTRARGFQDLLTGVLVAYQTELSLRQNEDMRKMSAWVAIFVAPTLIAGIYGMNFESMPELSWRFGYPAVLGLIGVVCLTLYSMFRRKGWL